MLRRRFGYRWRVTWPTTPARSAWMLRVVSAADPSRSYITGFLASETLAQRWADHMQATASEPIVVRLLEVPPNFVEVLAEVGLRPGNEDVPNG